MSAKRPTQVPRWAFGDAAVRVQPPTLSASEGFRVGTRVPGPWLNWQFNALGGWIDFLRAPNVNAFARVSWATSPGSYDSSSPVLLACDADTIETTGAAYRIVIAGWETSGPTSSLQVSQTGNAWTRRTNTPGGFGRPTALAHIACAPRWVIADDGPGLYYAPHDAGAGTSPIGGSSSGWTAATAADDGSGGVTAIKAIASSTSKAVAITAAGGLWSADGITWSAITEGTARTGNGLDVVWTGSALVYVTSDGEVYSSPTADGSFALKGTLPDGAAGWRLAAGDAGEVLAYQHNNGSASDLFRSTNDGASWSTLTPLAVGRDVLRLTCVRWRDGVWMATSSVAPFLWTSNDAVNWTALRVDVSGSGALQSIAWDGSAWIAAGNGFVVRCPRGADPAPGDYVADGDPATLADAASLRGRRIETGDPSDGDTLVWNAADEQWEYGAGGGSVAWGDITGTAAEGRAVLLERATYDFASSSGWTLNNGSAGGAAAITGGVARLTTPSGTQPHWHGATGNLTASHIKRALPSGDVTIRARLSALTNADALTRAGLFVKLASSNTRLAQVMVDSAGVVHSQGDSANNLTDTGGTTITLDSTAWLRLDVVDGVVRMWCGNGSGTAEPTRWIFVGETSRTAGVGLEYDECGLVLAQYDALAGNITFDVADLYAEIML